MKVTFLKAALTSIVLLATSVANAGLINSDYQTSGDNLTVTDLSSNLVWLDLSLTAGMSKASALSSYSDFRLATRSEYEDMMTSFFSSILNFNATGSSFYNLTLAPEWLALFGATSSSKVVTPYAYGWLEREISTNLQLGGVVGGTIRTNNETIFTRTLPYVGWFMVQDTQSASRSTPIPEPTSLILIALSLLGFAASRTKK